MSASLFHDSITKLLGSKLDKYCYQNVNSATCNLIYQDIFNSLIEVFTKAGHRLTNEAMNYLAQQYYDCVLINNNHELDPNIFNQRANLGNIEIKELVLLSMMLKGTDLSFPIIEEIKRRS